MADSYRARMAGVHNPHYSDAAKYFRCNGCGVEFRSYSPDRVYCSRECAKTHDHMRRVARKDKNHNEIVAVFRKLGCYVVELHQHGQGIPDLVVKCLEEWHPVEVKNPRSSYGKSGLSRSQLAFQQKAGIDVPIVRTIDDALALHRAWVTK